MTSYANEQQFSWRRARADEVATVHALHLAALAGMENGLVRPDTQEHFRRHIDELGAIVAAFAAFANYAGMVAYGVVGVDSPTAAHMAELLDIDSANAARFAILDGAASLPAWRGMRLHRELILERLRLAATLGRSLLGATVSPGNIPSMRGLFEAGFVIRRYGLLYGGLPRLVMQRDLLAQVRTWRLVHRVAATDLAGHDAAMTEGLVGFSCGERPQGGWEIHYAYDPDGAPSAD